MEEYINKYIKLNTQITREKKLILCSTIHSIFVLRKKVEIIFHISLLFNI